VNRFETSIRLTSPIPHSGTCEFVQASDMPASA
jgi:hypothetical protein